jgi:glycosyl transferase family 2
VIAFGCSITQSEVYERFAAPGIRLAAEPDSEILAFEAAGSIFRSYNLLLDKAAELDGLEGLVLVHQDAEIVDPDFVPKVRRALRDPDVGVVGCVGSLGARNLDWWEGSVTWASFIHRYSELGGGDLPALSWKEDDMVAYARLGEVDTVDGFVLCMSPWVVRNIRFDESFGRLHGYDFDFCCQVKEAGRKIVTEDLKVIHNHSLDLVSSPETWVEAHIRLAEKWEGRLPYAEHEDRDWKRRARRAEAEAAAAKAGAVSAKLFGDARVKQYEESASWRLTEPMRRLRAMLRIARRGDS